MQNTYIHGQTIDGTVDEPGVEEIEDTTDEEEDMQKDGTLSKRVP